jgi:hypothetical protein|tara:strand:+ start:20357 stop:21097 length:741 start_codon:yes stop_codon:yes gene_type:complete
VSVYLPDNRITAPELWYPGRKPTVPVRLNQKAKNKSIIADFFPSSAHRRELLRNTPISFVGDISFTEQGNIRAYSLGSYIYADIPSISKAFTIFVSGIYKSSGSYGCIISYGVAGNLSSLRGILLQSSGSPGSIRLQVVAGGNAYTTSPVVLLSEGDRFAFLASYNGAKVTLKELYSNNEVSIPASGLVNISTPDFYLCGNPHQAGGSLSQDVSTITELDRCIIFSDGNLSLNDFHINPYQFLEAA